jgi:hypothetical protein
MAWESATIFGLASLTFLFFWQAAKFDENAEDVHKYMKLLMYFLGWGGVLMIISVSRLIVDFSAPTATGVVRMLDVLWWIIISIVVLVVLYWMLFFAWAYMQPKIEEWKRLRGRSVTGRGMQR